MDAFSKALQADKREIVIAPTIYKFDDFKGFAEEFKLGERDCVLTNEFIYKPFMEELGLKCNFVFQEKFGGGEPSEAMIETMYEAIPYDSYDRVIAVGGGAIMDLCKLLGCKRPNSVHELYFKREPVVHEKEVIAIPTTCGTGSEVTNISVAIVKDEKDGKLTGGDTKLGLVSDDIMNLVRRDADRVFVGKRAGYHCVPQEEINQILLREAQQGKRVVRLKGGDPFIFGRGGEELETLCHAGIPFSVVPGITAASGCSAYSGIPLTHRDYAQSVRLVTGHLKTGGELDWENLAAEKQTLVFYMGLNQAATIQEKLIEFGMQPDMPVALVENGTSVKQRVVNGELTQLGELAQQVESPALIIVGRVVGLRDKLNWFSNH